MLAVNVQESTTTTGTGNITLAGASEDGRTFTSQFATNERFLYYIDDRAGNFENGVGYLSGAATLVRELVLNSSNADTLVNFGAGAKQVFVGLSESTSSKPNTALTSIGSVIKFIRSASVVYTNATHATVANRIYYVPFVLYEPFICDSIGVAITTGAGTASNKLHLGIYQKNPTDGSAGNLLASVTDLDPSVAAIVSGTIPEQTLQAGEYYVAYWSDTTPTLRASNGSIAGSGSSSLQSATTLRAFAWLQTDSVASLTDLPSAGTANDSRAAFAQPVMLLGKT